MKHVARPRHVRVCGAGSEPSSIQRHQTPGSSGERVLSRLGKRSLRPCSTVYYMDATAREFNQNSSRILAAAEAGETVTVTKNGRPVAIVRPFDESEVPAYPPGPMGDIELPCLDLPDVTDGEIEETLRGMGS